MIAHTRAGSCALVERFGADPARVHTIPHGAFDALPHQEEEKPLAPELAAVEGPVVLCFGVLRPYKGVDVLVDAFRGLHGAELWIVGRPWMDIEPLRRAASDAGSAVRFVDRYVADVGEHHRLAEGERRVEHAGLVDAPVGQHDEVGAAKQGGQLGVGDVAVHEAHGRACV